MPQYMFLIHVYVKNCIIPKILFLRYEVSWREGRQMVELDLLIDWLAVVQSVVYPFT